MTTAFRYIDLIKSRIPVENIYIFIETEIKELGYDWVENRKIENQLSLRTEERLIHEKDVLTLLQKIYTSTKYEKGSIVATVTENKQNQKYNTNGQVVGTCDCNLILLNMTPESIQAIDNNFLEDCSDVLTYEKREDL